MNINKKILISILLALALAGCNTVKPTHYLESDARTQLKDIETHLIVNQDEIYADIEGSNIAVATGGGLLFALIDAVIESSQAETAETTVEPIRDFMVDYDYAEVLHKNITQQITSIDSLKIEDVKLERSIEDKLFEKRYNDSNASAILFLNAKYNLTPGFDSVETTVEAFMFPVSESLKNYRETKNNKDNPVDLANNIYHNKFVSVTSLHYSSDKNENVRLLSSNPQTIKDALEKNAKEIALNLKVDLQKDSTGI